MGVAQPLKDALALGGQSVDCQFGVANGHKSPAKIVVLRVVWVCGGDLFFKIDESGIEMTLDRRQRLRLGQRTDRAGEMAFQFVLCMLTGRGVFGSQYVHQAEFECFEFVTAHMDYSV